MDDGIVWTWGSNLNEGAKTRYSDHLDTSTENVPDTAIKKADIDHAAYVAAGGYFTAAIKEDGSLWTWGFNAYGALGNGIDFAVPGEEFMIDSKPYKIMEDVESISLGCSWGMAVKTDGTLWTWGCNDYMCLGTGVEGESCVPVKIMEEVTAVSAGAYHGLALKKDGTVWGWGDNYSGQLGEEKGGYVDTPKRLMTDCQKIFVGYAHTIIIKRDGTLYTWGETRGAPAIDEIEKGATLIGGYNRTTLLSSDGSLKWYLNDTGAHPVTDSVAQASMYYDHLLVLKEDGSVWACGDNYYSQLGDGTNREKDDLVLIYQND